MGFVNFLIRANSATSALCFSWIISTSLIFGAWFFEFVIDLAPCPLCLEQRLGHYFIIILAPVVLLLIHKSIFNKSVITCLLLVILGLALWTGGLGVYHAGVEWQFWEGPATCSNAIDVALPQTSEELMAALALPNPVSCGDVAWSFLGLSLAGYNALLAGLIVTKMAVALTHHARPSPNQRAA